LHPVDRPDRSDEDNTVKRSRAAAQALAEMLPQSTPPTPVRAKVPNAPPPGSSPLVGSDVLDVIGSHGVPRRNMHDVIHTSDDEIVERPLGPLEAASVSFRPDPEAGDAGADLAEELGRSYLRSATTGEDISEIENADELDASEIGGPFLEIDTNAEQEDEWAEDEATDRAPVTHAASGEIPSELAQTDDEEWPDEKTLPYPAARRPRRSP
jgi:hypothetical protein